MNQNKTNLKTESSRAVRPRHLSEVIADSVFLLGDNKMSRPRIHNDIFKKYGRLNATSELKSRPYARRILCECECGNELVVNLNALLSGNTKSCGCLKVDRNKGYFTTHGLSKTSVYIVWSSMKDRCFREKCTAFKNYGGRGITICEEWLTFEPFYKWAIGNGYSNDLTIERKNNDGHYCPGNCTFIPLEEQSKNRRPFSQWVFKSKHKEMEVEYG